MENLFPLHPKHVEITVPIASHHSTSIEIFLEIDQRPVMVKCTLLVTNTKTATEKYFFSVAHVANSIETKEPMMTK